MQLQLQALILQQHQQQQQIALQAQLQQQHSQQVNDINKRNENAQMAKIQVKMQRRDERRKGGKEERRKGGKEERRN